MAEPDEVPELANPFRSLSAALGLEDISGMASPIHREMPLPVTESDVGGSSRVPIVADEDIFAEDQESIWMGEESMEDEEVTASTRPSLPGDADKSVSIFDLQ